MKNNRGFIDGGLVVFLVFAISGMGLMLEHDYKMKKVSGEVQEIGDGRYKTYQIEKKIWVPAQTPHPELHQKGCKYEAKKAPVKCPSR